MNLQPLFEMQDALDEKIVKEKGLEGRDLLPEKILALQVELGELANEWRGFKFWSENRHPRTWYARGCHSCNGRGYFSLMEEDDEMCSYCEGSGIEEEKNPLLEEFVDCLHFILSIGNDIEITLAEIESSRIRPKGIMGTFTDLFIGVGVLSYTAQPTKANYTTVASRFLHLGELLGFTWEQIETAYKSKNKVNHERQQNGY